MLRLHRRDTIILNRFQLTTFQGDDIFQYSRWLFFCPILLHLDITLVITQKYDRVESYNCMLVESVSHYFCKTKRMKSRLRFSSNCHLKKCNFLCCHILSIECQIHKLLFLAKRMIPRSSKSDNQKQSYANFKSSAFAIWPIRS